MNKYLIFAALSVLASSISQTILKSSANETHKNKISAILNVKVICAYVIFFGVTLINSLFIFKHVELSQISMIETLGYIFVPILAYMFFKEKLNKSQLFGLLLIITGAIVYCL